MPYYDLRDNFPSIFQELKSFYYEGLESYKQPHTVMWARKSSRSSVKRTAKKQYSLKQAQKIEGQLRGDNQPKFGYIQKKNGTWESLIRDQKLLVIHFQGNKHIGYVAATNIGHVGVLWFDWCKSWLAFGIDPEGALFAVYESKISYQDALARLFALPWGSHIFTDREYSLYELYRGIYFYFADAKAKRPRNNTIKFRTHPEVTPIWS